MLGPKRRNRARIACIPCQIRKRKCSGTQPCSTCAHLRSACQYGRGERYVRPLQQPESPPGGSSVTKNAQNSRGQLTGEINHIKQLTSIEANSGAAFARRLGLKIDPHLAPKLNMFAWNLGLRYLPSPSLLQSSVGAILPIVDIISLNEMRFLAAVYFEKVDPYYPFLDRDELYHHMEQTWLASSQYTPFSTYEGILCGVAALGSLFSRKKTNDTETQLVELARSILDGNLRFHTPSIDLINAWVLRVSYLRIAGIPHLAWIASCTLMHLIEAAGLHMEPLVANILAHSPDDTSLENRRRLFGIARHFNLWISFDLGRTRVTFPTATTRLPEISTEFKNIFSFLALSESLDPEHLQDVSTLEQALIDIMNIGDLQSPMILTQCNLMLCVHRRLRTLNVSISGEMLDHFLGIARQGLRATQEMVLSHSPWHQVANIPFQIVCAMLAIDNNAAISFLPEAMQVLCGVARSYDTEVMREARNTALLLIRLHQRQKERDAKTLGEIIQTELPLSEGSSQSTSISGEPSLPDQASNFWVDNTMLDMESFQLEPLLAVDDGLWPTTSFEIP